MHTSDGFQKETQVHFQLKMVRVFVKSVGQLQPRISRVCRVRKYRQHHLRPPHISQRIPIPNSLEEQHPCHLSVPSPQEHELSSEDLRDDPLPQVQLRRSTRTEIGLIATRPRAAQDARDTFEEGLLNFKKILP